MAQKLISEGMLSYLSVYRERGAIMEIQQNWDERNKFRIHFIRAHICLASVGLMCAQLSLALFRIVTHITLPNFLFVM